MVVTFRLREKDEEFPHFFPATEIFLGSVRLPMEEEKMTAIREYVNRVWDESVIQTLSDYINIRNLSPDFDPAWQENMELALGLFLSWISTRNVAGLTASVERLPGRPPLLLIEIPATKGYEHLAPVLIYGHCDKQPPFEGWDADRYPEGMADADRAFIPVLEDGKLYGRGGADDGYAMFAALTAIEALQASGVPHAKCVVVIECGEESDSPGLMEYMDVLAERIGTPDLVVCLDSGCDDYDHLWTTTSLRGVVGGVLKVEVLTEGVHSGQASGIVPDTFRIARGLLECVENAENGTLLPPFYYAPIPADRVTQAQLAAKVLGDSVYTSLPWIEGARPTHSNHVELLLNRTWRPTLTVTGADGLPPTAKAGNVLRPSTSLKLSLRLPPGVDPVAAVATLKSVLERDQPYGACVTFTPDIPDAGWNAPSFAPWLEASMNAASEKYFGASALCRGEGGSIAFMNMLGTRFPKTQFMVTGLLGPGSNAHGPNEFLHLPTAEKLTCCVAAVLAGHAARSR